jgi:hypothetical protein
METTSPQTLSLTEVKPVEIQPGTTPEFTGDLESAVQNSLKQIKHCEDQANLWLKKKEELQSKMNEALERIQKQVANGSVPEKKKVPLPIKVDKDSTIPDLIRSYLDKNGPARTKDIRKFLLGQGRKTNPGVALGRMKKDGILKNVERGLYKIS